LLAANSEPVIALTAPPAKTRYKAGNEGHEYQNAEMFFFRNFHLVMKINIILLIHS
jgi:hypothetical protein